LTKHSGGSTTLAADAQKSQSSEQSSSSRE